MSFYDQSHINRVRDALWQRSGGGASVMIGSGFSRNALLDADDPPTWREVARAVYDKLYPQDGDGDPGTATSDFLRLAQEYEAAFGRGDLHRFLRELIRDDDFLPGDIHTRLLSLPWRDVFTTNWDTLLERARPSVADHAYSVVQNMDEIPLANQPRIVKLHGSFPSDFPLIFTEEDYRTYPAKFAPFVNTVQQAMMETMFCLIGFSGDDPNFLQWSGWVRDNLGDAAPKIYLAGWLELSSHRRRMLEDRKVVPIDLALHPKASEWPEHLQHQYATEWLLHTLEHGRPYDISEWPSRPSWQHLPVPELIQPVEEVVSDEPENELPEKEKGSLLDSVRNILKIWTHNRTIYPGWLTAPASARSLMDWSTKNYESRILDVFSELTPVERLEAIHELVWRWEILLNPISSKLESAAQDVLNLIDCQNRTINGSTDPGIEWNPIRKAWRTVALALVTAARHSLDHDVFEQRIKALSPFLQDDLDVDHRIRHERCLWAMYSMDFEALNGLLKDWRTENCDPVWMMRKTAVLFETGRQDEATALAKHALTTIRAIPTGDLSLAGPSRESWALWLVAQPQDYQMRFKRWNELAPLKCNALMERELIADAIKGNGETKKVPSFDFGTRRAQGLSFSNTDPRGAAYRAIRLSEVAGLPPSGDRMDIAVNILKLAAEKLVASDPEMAARLVLRVLTYDRDETLMRVFSRTFVAALSADSARTLEEICNSVIEYALPRIVGTDSRGHRPIFWIERMRVAMEVLSRLVLRQEPEKVETIFNKALEYYRNDHVAREFWLDVPVRNLLNRSWKTLPEDCRTARALDLLNAPIVGLDNFKADSNNYPDPGDLLQDALPPPTRTDDNESRWQEIVSLLVRGLHTGGEARKRASLRIAPMVFWGRLAEAESSQVAQALWSEKYTSPSDLPGETLLFDWAFLLFPEPELGLAEQCFRRKWLTASNAPQEDAPSRDDILWQVGKTISCLKNHQRSLELSEDERAYLIEVVEQWSDTPVPSHFFPFVESELHEPTLQALIGLRTVISEIQIPVPIGEKLYKKVQGLTESGSPGFGLIAGLVKAMPNRFDELALTMRTGLVSENVDIAEGAAVGLHHWLMASAEVASHIQPPPNDLVREIGIMIATRRKKALGQALEIAKWVFDEGKDEQRETIRDLALQGLGYLVEELRYDREHDQDDDVPFLRWACAHLALAMAECGLGDDPAVTRWLETAKEDPLPEVRYAKSSDFAQSSREKESAGDEPPTQTG